ncbi:MAG TPA: hypothetical protein VFR96_16760 [Povalibacter sp.]|nr:hypothetical protein [Povalibacter sp.]
MKLGRLDVWGSQHYRVRMIVNEAGSDFVILRRLAWRAALQAQTFKRRSGMISMS